MEDDDPSITASSHFQFQHWQWTIILYYRVSPITIKNEEAPTNISQEPPKLGYIVLLKLICWLQM